MPTSRLPLPARIQLWLSDYAFALLAPLLALLAVALLQPTGWAQRLENLTLSFRFQIRAPWDPPADSRLLLVGVDQPSLAYLGKWPWPRTVEADFLKAIAQSGMNPRTVAFDMFFTEKNDQYHDLRGGGVDMDDQLGEAAGLLPSVITGAEILPPTGVLVEDEKAAEETQAALREAALTQPFSTIKGNRQLLRGSDAAALPVGPLRKQSLFGLVNDDPSPIDGIRYRVPLVMRIGEEVYPSLALQVICQILHVDADHVTVDVGQEIVLRNSSRKTWRIPINSAGEMAINYRRSSGFAVISFKGLFEFLTQHLKFNQPIPPEGNIDKKALLIATVTSTDLGLTPLQAECPLVYTHLNAINDVLRNDYLVSVPWPWVALGWLAVNWLSLFALHRSTIAWAIGLPTAVILSFLLAATAIFWVGSIEIAVVWPTLAYFAVQFTHGIRLWLAEARSKVELKAVFARMLSPEVMNHVLSNPAGLELGGTTRSVTILFSDIRDYTKISEHIGNEELVRQLNTYFEEMVDCVTKYRGTFHKFIGDAIMAVWGDISAVSAGVEEDARNSVRAALEMRRRLVELNRTRTAAGLLPLRIGIGLNFGEVLVGQIGAARRSEFTVMGDPVNVASRLEGMTKEFKTDLAIGESVEALLGDAFITRPLGLVQLKGKSKPMLVYEVLGERENAASLRWQEKELHVYRKAFDQFLARDFHSAEAGFSACLAQCPDDSCAERYQQASRQFAAAPPPDDWDGRVVMETK